jgi:hypothetical protein
MLVGIKKIRIRNADRAAEMALHHCTNGVVSFDPSHPVTSRLHHRYSY